MSNNSFRCNLVNDAVENKVKKAFTSYLQGFRVNPTSFPLL